MAIRRASKSSISTTSSGKRFNLIAGYSPAVDEMDLIQRVTVGVGGASTITFSSIPQTYQHLHIRGMLRSTESTGVTSSVGIQLNGVTSGYASHFMLGDGTTLSGSALTSQTHMFGYRLPGSTATASVFGVLILDIMDYTNTTKNKAIRSINGVDVNGSGATAMSSGLLISTSAVTSITIDPRASANFAQHSTVSLYGVVG